MINLDSVLKSRDITLLTKVYIVKAMVFPVVIYGCESWTIKKAVYVCLVAQFCPNPCNPMDCSLLGSFVHGDSPGKNTGVGCHAFLQGIFLSTGLNRRLLCLLPHNECHILSTLGITSKEGVSRILGIRFFCGYFIHNIFILYLIFPMFYDLELRDGVRCKKWKILEK